MSKFWRYALGILALAFWFAIIMFSEKLNFLVHKYLTDHWILEGHPTLRGYVGLAVQILFILIISWIVLKILVKLLGRRKITN
jgi:hypothetical protein